MITEHRKQILLEYERLSDLVSDLMQHWHSARPELNQQRIDALQAVSRYAEVHNITTAEMTELKRDGRPVCSNVKQALSHMAKYFGKQNDNT